MISAGEYGQPGGGADDHDLEGGAFDGDAEDIAALKDVALRLRVNVVDGPLMELVDDLDAAIALTISERSELGRSVCGGMN